MVIALALTACAAPVSTGSTGSTGSDPTEFSGLSEQPTYTTDIDGAIAVDVDSTPNGAVVAWSSHDAVSLAELDIDTGALTDTRVVSGDFAPVHHPIERPAVVPYPDGSVRAAFVSPVAGGGSVFISSDGSAPSNVSGPPRPETNLVHATSGPDGRPILTWLEDSTLSVAHLELDSLVEVESVDALTCDCCNPAPAVSGESLVVAYRDYEERQGSVVRNVVAVRSLDGGRTFEEPVAVADEDWAIDGCPFTGPTVAVVDGAVVVAWMDARQSRYPEQDGASIWVDRSSDSGGGFGADLEVASDVGHRWPTMTVDDAGVIHLFWETTGPDGGISYAWSVDAGVSFSPARLIVGRQINDDGAPGSPTAAYHDGMVILTWADSRSGHVAAWSAGS